MENEKREPPSMKVFIFPTLFAVILALAVHFAAPEMGIFAWGSAGFGAFFVLSIWGMVNRS